MRCAVYECDTDYRSKKFTKDIMFFRFPNEENLAEEWVNACRRGDKVNVKNSRICSKHFDNDSYKRNLKFELLGYSSRNRRLLKHDAVPTLNLPRNLPTTQCNYINKDRVDCLNKRNCSEYVEDILQVNNCNEQGSFRDGDKMEESDSMGNNDVMEADIASVSDGDNKIALRRDFGTNTDIDERDGIIEKLKKENERLRNENNKLKKNLFS